MSEFFQLGQHPDAEQLSAFEEDALPAHERLETLAHLAECPHCRRIVSLSMPPVEEILQPVAARKPWFSGWNLAWAATAATFATAIVVAIHFHHAVPPRTPTVQMAEVNPPAPSVISEPPAPSQVAPKATTPRPPKVLLPPHDDTGTTVEDLPVQSRNSGGLFPQDTRSRTTAEPAQLNGALASGAASAAPPLVAPASPHSLTLNRLANVAAPPAPANGQVAQQPAASALVMAEKSVNGAALPQMSDTVTVNASGVELETENASIASLPEQKFHNLPSHLAIASVIERADQTLALDTGGALFLSKDAGHHWKRVTAPWTGRAVTVTVASFPLPPKATLDADSNAASTLVPIHQDYDLNARSSLTGTVVDPTGATIPGASITVTDTRTSAARSLTTDSSGHYAVSNLDPGAYRVEAQAAGFEKVQVDPVSLGAAQQMLLNLSLHVGAASETVSVQSSAAPLKSKAARRKAAKSPAVDSPASVFEIITDTGDRWTSTDGETWQRN